MIRCLERFAAFSAVWGYKTAQGLHGSESSSCGMGSHEGKDGVSLVKSQYHLPDDTWMRPASTLQLKVAERFSHPSQEPPTHPQNQEK